MIAETKIIAVGSALTALGSVATAMLAQVSGVPIDWATITGLGCFALCIVVGLPLAARTHTRCASDQRETATTYQNTTDKAIAEMRSQSTHDSDRICDEIRGLKDCIISTLRDTR